MVLTPQNRSPPGAPLKYEVLPASVLLVFSPELPTGLSYAQSLSFSLLLRQVRNGSLLFYDFVFNRLRLSMLSCADISTSSLFSVSFPPFKFVPLTLEADDPGPSRCYFLVRCA